MISALQALVKTIPILQTFQLKKYSLLGAAET